MGDTISLLQVTPFQSHNLYVTVSSKHVETFLHDYDFTYFDKSKWGNMGVGGGGGGRRGRGSWVVVAGVILNIGTSFLLFMGD